MQRQRVQRRHLHANILARHSGRRHQLLLAAGQRRGGRRRRRRCCCGPSAAIACCRLAALLCCCLGIDVSHHCLPAEVGLLALQPSPEPCLGPRLPRASALLACRGLGRLQCRKPEHWHAGPGAAAAATKRR